jgi:glycine dehydrogenase
LANDVSPHGGGGPGVGPICVAEHLAPFLPGHDLVQTGGAQAIDAVSSAPFGSASACVISWAYIKMLGGLGLADSTKLALLNANYIAHRLAGHYTLRFKNAQGRVAHELLIDLAEFEKSAGLKVTDFAKRLQDYSFHPPTCSWPLSTCMLIEPTESETLEELDRFCDAMIAIRREVQDVIDGVQPRDNNVLTNAPHPAHIVALADDEWKRPYSRFAAAYPMPYLLQRKFWPTISRIDDAYGDLNLIVRGLLHVSDVRPTYAHSASARLLRKWRRSSSSTREH